MVFFHHAFQIPLLWSGVDLFFILSGYLITTILLRDRERMSFGKMLKQFYVRRAERILPAYFLFLLLAYGMVRTDLNHLWPFYLFFLQNIPYAFHMISAGPLIPLWSLAVEQHFYLLWPPVIYFLPRRWLKVCMLLLMAVTPLLRALCTPLFASPDAIYCLTPFRVDALAAGALAALLLPQCRPAGTIRLAKVSMLVGVVAYALLSLHPWFRRSTHSEMFNSFAYSLNILILGGLFVWAVLSRDTPLTRFLSLKPLRWLGRISYMFYLLHLGILMHSIAMFKRPLGAVVGFAVTAGLASLSWRFVEKPILSLSAGHRRAAPPTETARS